MPLCRVAENRKTYYSISDSFVLTFKGKMSCIVPVTFGCLLHQLLLPGWGCCPSQGKGW